MKTQKINREEMAECLRLKGIWQAKKKALGLTQQDVADAFGEGATQGAVSHYLNGRNALNVKAAAIFSRLLKVPVADFSPRLASMLSTHAIPLQDAAVGENTSAAYVKGWVPLISYVQAGQWSEAIDIYEPGCSERVSPTTTPHTPSTFALRVEGPSMTLPPGVEGRSFPHGMIIYVDPGKEALPGDYVVARYNGDNLVTFKRLVLEEGRPILAPLNPDRQNYPVLRDEFEIIGKVIDASWGGL